MKKEIIGLFPMVGDLLHAGHLIALKQAKEQCDKLVVALNVAPDGKKPVETVYERFVRLEACEYVDKIIVYAGEEDLLNICRTYEYNIRFVGEDHKDNWTGKDIESERDIWGYILPRKHSWSSTDLKQRIREAK